MLKIISRDSIKDEKVTVEVDGKEVTRKVHYDASAGDLFIWCDNYEFLKN